MDNKHLFLKFCPVCKKNTNFVYYIGKDKVLYHVFKCTQCGTQVAYEFSQD